MNLNALLVAALFTIPGLIAWELANLFTPHRSKRTEGQMAVNLLFFGGMCLALVSRYRDTVPHRLVLELADSKTSGRVGWDIYWQTAISILLLSLMICVWRKWLKPRSVLTAIKLFGYEGEVHVWESATSEILKGRHVQVFTKDNWYYFGEIETAPTIVGDKDIFLKVYSFAKLDEEGREYFSNSAEEGSQAVYISEANVARVLIHRMTDEGREEEETQNQPESDSGPATQPAPKSKPKPRPFEDTEHLNAVKADIASLKAELDTR